jgi:hypothetical protein
MSFRVTFPLWFLWAGEIPSPLGTSATILAYCTSSECWVMIVNQSVERFARKIEVLEENLRQCHFFHHKSRMTLLELKSGPLL